MACPYASLSVCFPKAASPSSPSPLSDTRFSSKHGAACRASLTDMAALRVSSLPNPNFHSANARKPLRHPAFAFIPSGSERFSVENLSSKNDADGEQKPLSEADVRAAEPEQTAQTASEYKPFSFGEIEQNVTRNTKYKPYKQKHRPVTTTFQPLGPGYPPITLEELEADLAKSNYKPFSRFENKSDVAAGGKPFGSEYKPFTLEELEQRAGVGTDKKVSRQGGKSFPAINQALESQYTPLSVEELHQGSSKSSYGMISSPASKPSLPDVMPLEAPAEQVSVEGTNQMSFSSIITEDSAAQSSGIEATPSSEESAVRSSSEIAQVEPPRLSKLYAGNIPWDYDNKQLEELFKEHGSVFVAEVIKDNVTGRSRGFGFVCMSSPEDAEAAIRNLDGKEIGGRKIKVTHQETAEDRYKRVSRGGGNNSGEGNNNVNKLFVANLPWNVDEETLGKLFSDFGPVVEAKIAFDRATGRSRGFGFVTLSAASEVTNAIAALHGSEYQGRILKVAVATEKPPVRSSVF